MIQNDLQKLFEFIEPSDCNLKTYSFRIHELFMRTCIEIEANFKAILKENIYNPKRGGKLITDRNWNIHNYKIVNKTHHLASYKVYIPIWDGEKSIFKPFAQWGDTTTELSWYQAYNRSKHDRKIAFKESNFGNLLNAVTGLLVLLSSQFGTQDFTPENTTLSVSIDSYYATEPALGGFFHIEFPSDWREEEKYNFNWADLKQQPDRFQKIDYDKTTRNL
ncbi:MAG: hypothetical protein DRH37_11570 [Deltaproteobacteria bacterium]|nr:MAG: hypothetical protein DRH37_11570 [Deltaproteobacteria bacterium]